MYSLLLNVVILKHNVSGNFRVPNVDLVKRLGMVFLDPAFDPSLKIRGPSNPRV